MSEYPDPSPQDLLQEATGEGVDPDQTWDDEPDDLDPVDVDDPDDHNDGDPEVER